MRMRKENRGLTLVELMLTFAILSIVLTVATSFMVTGSRSFTKGSADSDLQKEAELTVNQIEDMVIDVTGGLTMTDDADKAELVMIHAMQEPDETGTLETKYIKESVVWEKSGDKMKYSKWNVHYDEATKSYVVDGSPVADNQLLAERVSLFEVDLDTVDETASDGTIYQIVRSVQIRVGYEHGAGNVDYATSPVITLRNRMLLSGDPAEIFVEPPTVSAKMKLYYCGDTTEWLDKQIEDRVSEVKRGSEYKITAKLETGGTPVSNDLLDWEIEETNRTSSITSEGRLVVGANEPNDYLSIVARYKTNSNKYARGVVKVMGGNAKSFDKITITRESLKAFHPTFGSHPTLTGPWTQDEINAITYKWEVNEPERVEEFVDNKSTLELNVKEGNYGKFIEITLTAYSPTTGQTRYDTIKYLIDNEGAGGDSFMRRGMVLGGAEGSEIYLSFDTDYALYVDWEWYFCTADGQETHAYDHLREHIVTGFCEGNRAHFDYQLSYDEELPLNQEYYVKIIAHLSDGKGTDWTWERIHYIPAVQLFDYHKYGNNSEYFHCYFGMIGYYDVALQDNPNIMNGIVGWEVAQLDYEASDWIDIETKISQIVANNGAGYNGMRMEGVVSLDNRKWTPDEFVNLMHLRLKVYMIKYPEVYTYVDIYFK